ncbi:hypothetical protein GWK47_000611 [Chionoecetes opilio]|uniref:Uncharacterized protein n=1 Tax=Chionoecetes opilio TaxID=41210 RepID=A0A8J4YG64_CHIOP|nr:hypothetical protein GWK47_000611 [Chionoecetes opilio]
MVDAETPRPPGTPPGPVRAGDSSRSLEHRRNVSGGLWYSHKTQVQEVLTPWLGYDTASESRTRSTRTVVTSGDASGGAAFPCQPAPTQLFVPRLRMCGTFVTAAVPHMPGDEHTSVKVGGPIGVENC